MMKKTFFAVSACMVAFGAHAADLPAEYAEKGKVVAANTPNYPPMEYRDPATNELMGLDIDLGTALAEKLGIEIEWSEIGFEQMVSSLNTGRADIILSGMSDLPARRDSMDFLDYMTSGAQFYIQTERAEEFKELTDLCGESVGMSRRTSFPDEAKKWSDEHCVGNDLPPLTIVGTEGSADARTQLTQGRVAAAVQGSETLPYLLDLDPGKFEILGEPFTVVHQGIGFSKETPELRDAFAAALKELMESGEYEAIFAKYGLEGAILDTIMINEEAVE